MVSTGKKCRECRCELVVGENWSPSLAEHGSRLCKRCNTNYMCEYNYITGKSTPLGKNKNCALFLGVYVAETILSNVFKNVKRMPTNNPGYDFRCNHGKKIDVKSGCVCVRRTRAPAWQFHITRNMVADYFLCLAFDNRENLNPLHMWLIPGKVVNHLSSLYISTTTIDKWKEYELDISEVVDCCDVMKY